MFSEEQRATLLSLAVTLTAAVTNVAFLMQNFGG